MTNKMILPILLSPFLNAIITDPVKNIIVSVKRHVCYAFKYRSNVEKLQEEATVLENKKVRLQKSADKASRNGKEIYDNVTKWLTNADKEILEAKELIDGEEQAKQKRCFIGLCPNLKTRYQFSKKADKKVLAIDKLKNEQELESVYFSPKPEQRTASSVYSREDLQSRVSMLKEVMDALKDPNLNMIGVYGMGGVGKTTLAKEVHREAQIDKLFDVVVMVAVSQSPEIRRIQNEIAEILGLALQEEGMPLRAKKLFDRLKNEKNILIILDDVWKQLQLEELGIPFGDDHKGCKLLVTSRRADVCRAMGANKDFIIEVLSDKEAWSLFEMTVADGKDQPKLPSIATEIAKKCSGLPLLILIVATDLRTKEPYAWDDKLRQLSSFDNEDIQVKVHTVLESSYYNLPNNEVKSFFLLCGLFGQSNIRIQHLLEYSIGLGLFKYINSVEGARNRVDRLIHDLKAECLLLDGDMDGFVKMHDVVRDTVMSIASRVQHALVGTSGFGVREWPMEEDCTRISLPYCDIEELPEGLKYPKAEILLLFTEDFSLRIPDLFFEGIRKLKVVDLTGMYFASLPSSLGFLENIHTLRLQLCQLNDITIIGEMKQLEVLSFADSYIVELPRQMEKLTRLKLIDLSNCSKLKVIPANIFSKMSMLEELYMNKSFVRWEAEGIDYKYNKGNASLAEFEELSRLTTLELQVVDAKMIPKTLSFNTLQRYKILIGDEWNWHGNYQTSKTLKLKHLTSTYLEHGLKVLLKASEDLHLDEVRGIGTALSDVDGEGFPRMKNLHIQNNPGIQYIINSTKCPPCHAFPILESLFLDNLQSLEQMCHGQLLSGSFRKLRNLKVMKCNSLTNLFSFSIARCLSQLEGLEVYCCNNIEYIFIGESGEKDEIVELSELCSLILKDLPNLRCFFNEKEATADPACEESVFVGTSSSLFNRKVHFPNLKDLQLQKIACEKIWKNQLPVNLTSLEVGKCDNLKHLFTISLLKSLVLLNKLVVSQCENMEEIILTEEELVDMIIVFPKLDVLWLMNLPKLITFCRGYFIEFQSLRELNIHKCSKFTSFVSKATEATQETSQSSEVEPLFNEMVAFSNLEVMNLTDMYALKSIWHNQLATDSFCNLKSLSVEFCGKLSTVFPSNVLGRFQRLEKLKVRYCYSVLEVYHLQGFNDDEIENGELVFELRDLCIEGLTLLKHIWSKDTQGVVTFQNLQSIHVYRCEGLKNIFPVSLARNLPQLEKLKVENCGVEEIVAKAEEGIEDPCFKFPQLSSFIILNLQNLTSFYPGTHTSEWPKLKCLEVDDCDNVMKFASEIYSYKEAHGESKQNIPIPGPLFLVEKVNPYLEELTLERKDLMLIESCGLFPVEHFSNLKVVKMCGLRDETQFFLKRLYNLDRLIVFQGSMEELFSYEGLVGEEQLVCVKHLVLYQLFFLKHIWMQHYRLKPLLHYLQTLHVEGCSRLINLATVSTVKTMTRLMKLRISDCENMTEIVANDADDHQMHEEITFSKLKYLELKSLKSLTSFCSRNHTFNFPSLEQVIVNGCSKMKIFSFGALSTPKLRNVYFKDEGRWEGNLNATIASLLEKWVADEYIPANVLQYCTNLTKIKVKDSDSVEQVFDLEGLSADDGPLGLLIKLEKLKLFNLPCLNHLWNKNPWGILNFKNLRILEVKGCHSLRYVFTLSMALGLLQLKEIHLLSCKMMEGLIEAEEAGLADKLILPSLKSVVLEDLPNFSSFHSGSGGLECPSLIEIRICRCLSFSKAFISTFPKEEDKAKTDGGQGKNELHIHMMSPNLEELTIEQKDLMVMESGVFPVERFPKLKVVTLMNFKDKRHCFFKKLHYLEKLVVKEGSVTELYPHEEEEQLVHVKHLELSRLHCLKHIWKLQHPQLKSVLQDLHTLKVESCSDLINIVPSSSSFQNLSTLDVQGCGNLVNLVTASIAKTMIQLAGLRVSSCQKMIEIVENDGDDHKQDEIIFPKLKYLELAFLSSLTSFSSGDHGLSFPSLENVIIYECSEVKIFSRGAISTPMLRGIGGYTGKKCWKGDINATIINMEEATVGFTWTPAKDEKELCRRLKLLNRGRVLPPLWS